jgi:WXG100 family type VII secretion target
MPNRFDHSSVQQYGGVAWAKEQINLLDPGAIDQQVQGYAQVKSSLNQIVDTLNAANTSIQSSWSGDAATAASQTFTETSNHAQNVVGTVNNTINQLQTAKTAAHTAIEAMSKVPDEKPIPSGGLFSGFTNAVSDIFTGTDPVQQAEQHNTAARNQAAEVLNNLSTSYDTAANNMTSIAGSKAEGGGFTATSSSGSFDLGSGSYSGGSGAAGSYSGAGSGSGGTATMSRTPNAGGVNNGVFQDGSTTLQGVTALPVPTETHPLEMTPVPPTTTTTTTTPVIGGLNNVLSEPTETGKLGSTSGKSSTSGGKGLFGEDGTEGRSGGGKGKSGLKSSNVFGEDGFGEEAGTSGRRGGAGAGENQEQQSGMQRGGGGRRGGAGGGIEEEELGSSKYSRGRFFGGEEAGTGREEWVQPAVGGDESLLVKGGGHGSGTGRVTSAYDGATDADGKPLQMARGAGRRIGDSDDEDDERGQRPDYLKEDPEWWQSAQRVAPPVVE